jgi:hypothetical protein
MGIDFIRKAAPRFNRSLDVRAVALRTPKLFARDIPLMARSARATICQSAPFQPNERVLLRVLNDKLVAQRDNLVVAEFSNPPTEMLNQVRCGGGFSEGEVKAVNPLSETVEIEICE